MGLDAAGDDEGGVGADGRKGLAMTAVGVGEVRGTPGETLRVKWMTREGEREKWVAGSGDAFIARSSGLVSRSTWVSVRRVCRRQEIVAADYSAVNLGDVMGYK